MKRKPKAIVIGGSAGSIPVVAKILSGLPYSYPFPVIVCLHRMKNIAEGMCEVLSKASLNNVVEPDDKEIIKKGNIYIAPSNYHLLVEDDFTFSLSTDLLVNYSRPSIDITLQSCSRIYGNKLIGILLTGANKDGAEGMCSIKKGGGITIVQDPKECAAPFMPLAAVEKHCIDYVMKSDEIVNFLRTITKNVI